MRRGLEQLRGLAIGSGFILVLLSLSPASASSANISHSYSADGAVPNGSLVSLNQNRTNYVELANGTNGQQLLGVAVANNDSLLAVDAASGKVQVATSGIASALVSTLNGPVKVGDLVAVSPLDGIGAEAEPGSRVIGLAQTAFNKSTNGAQQESVTNKQGKTHQVWVGYVRVNISIGTAGSSGASQLNGLQRFVQSVTGRTVSTVRIVISMIIALVALAALITLMYASVYSAIVAIGRNPLAKYAVLRTLFSTLAIALITAIISVIVIFLLLR